MTFQSRFGKAEWLQPYTDKTLASLGAQGTNRVDVICPGFACDCLETLEEIAVEARHTFLGAGGKTFHYLPVANDSEAYVAALTQIALDHLQGWVGTTWDREAAALLNSASADNARAMDKRHKK